MRTTVWVVEHLGISEETDVLFPKYCERPWETRELRFADAN